MKKTILILTNYPPHHLSISSPINSLANILSQWDFRVIVTVFIYSGNDNCPSLNSYEIIPFQFRNFIINYSNHIYGIIKKCDISTIISVDQRALVASYFASFQTAFDHYHLSLELPNRTKKDIKSRILNYLDGYALRRVNKVIIQDMTRFQLLTNGRIDDGKAFILPNTRIGFFKEGRLFFFNERFDIPKHKTIVLFTGSLIKEHLAHEAVQSVTNWPEDCVLVMHGRISNHEYRQYLEKLGKQAPGKVFFSDFHFSQNEIDLLFASVDIGLVLYDDIDDNFKFIGCAAGKVFDFMRAGIPIIINKKTNAYHLIEKHDCGVCIDTKEDISGALEFINGNRNLLRKHCLDAFISYEFSSRVKPLLSHLESGNRPS